MLVKDEIPRGCWKIAKVISLASSRDGEIRSAKVQLSSGRVMGRPLKLYPLEISNNSKNGASTAKMTTLDARPKPSTVENTMRQIKQCLQ